MVFARTAPVFIVILFMLSACAGITGVHEAPDGHRLLNGYLSKEYKRLARYEADDMQDYIDADYFSSKAIAASEGGFVEPTLIRERKLTDARVAELTKARSDLVAALMGNAKPENWPLLAQAQAAFDCWIEREEDGSQPDEIEDCKSRFHEAMRRASGSVILSQAFMIFFPTDSMELDQSGDQTIRVIAQIMANNPDLRIAITGNADTRGKASYNAHLSKKRALAVFQALQNAGVNTRHVKINAAGEKNPMVQTPNGVYEPKNRRVDVFLAPAE